MLTVHRRARMALSAYERERQRNIEGNNEKLHALGLGGGLGGDIAKGAPSSNARVRRRSPDERRRVD